MSLGRALVMGLGRFGGGLGATRFLLERGWDVTVTDLGSPESLAASVAALSDDQRERVTWRLGEHLECDFEGADLVVVNPAVPAGNAFVTLARAAGARVTSEVELFLESATANLVLVTGTQGKSSTCHLVHGLLPKALGTSRRVGLAGNMGRSLLAELDGMSADDELVIELSSYQLEALPGDMGHLAKAKVAVITNLLTDHIARHGNVAAYHAAKLRIAQLLEPGGTLVVPHSQVHLVRNFAGPVLTFDDQAATAPGQAADFHIEGAHFQGRVQGSLAPLADLRLPGAWQRPNALAALAAASLRGIAPADLHLAAIDTLEHRSEELGHFGKAAVRVVDNGVSTTPDSTQSALEALIAEAPGPIILLVGGRSKAMPLAHLALAAARSQDVSAITFGEAAAEFAAAFQAAGVPVQNTATLELAVTQAFENAPPQSRLLFSPAGSSFDAFDNFKARAAAFRRALPRRTPQIQL